MKQYVLRVGSNGEKVSELQRKLVEKKYLVAEEEGHANVDGRFGDRTFRAVRKFQETEGLASDGVVGAATAAKLGLDWSDMATIAPRQNGILTAGQITRLAEVIDTLVPTFVVDPFDRGVIEDTVELLDGLLAKNLRGSLRNVLQDVARGIEDGDFSEMRDKLTRKLQESVNDFWFLSNEIVDRIIAVVVRVLFDGLRLGSTLSEALNRALVTAR